MDRLQIKTSTLKWFKAAGIRALKTAAQTAVATMTVGQLVTEVDWIGAASIAVTAAVISLLTSVANLPEVE